MCCDIFTKDMNSQYNKTFPNLSLFHLCPTRMSPWFSRVLNNSTGTIMGGLLGSEGWGPQSFTSIRSKAQGIEWSRIDYSRTEESISSILKQCWQVGGLPQMPALDLKRLFNKPEGRNQMGESQPRLPPPKGAPKVPQVRLVKILNFLNSIKSPQININNQPSPNKTVFKFISAHHGNCVHSLAKKGGGEIRKWLMS